MRSINPREQIEQKDDGGRVIRNIRIKKQREGVDGEENDFVLHVVEDGTKNRYGKARTSCVVAAPVIKDAPTEVEGDNKDNRHVGAKISKGEQLFLQCVLDATAESGVAAPPALGLPRSVRVVDYDQVKRLMANRMLREDDNTEDGRKRHRERAKQAVGRARVALLNLKIIGCHDPYIWHTGKAVKGMSATQPRNKDLFDDRAAPPADDLNEFWGEEK